MIGQTLAYLYRSRILHFLLIFLLLAGLQANAAVEPGDRIGGTVTATVDGKTIHLPLLKTDISADIRGDLTSVTVTQTFANPTTTPLNAIPLALVMATWLSTFAQLVPLHNKLQSQGKDRSMIDKIISPVAFCVDLTLI